MSKPEINPTFITLGPEGTDHHTVVERFIRFQGLKEIAQIEFVEDIIKEGPEIVLSEQKKFLVLCAAHPRFHIVNEAHHTQITVMDSFLSPTTSMSILKRSDVEKPKTMALMEATHGYVDLDQLHEDGITILPAQSKPVIGQMLLEGECDAGLTFTRIATQHPEELDILEEIGEVSTSWTIFAQKQFGQLAKEVKGVAQTAEEVIGIKHPELFMGRLET